MKDTKKKSGFIKFLQAIGFILLALVVLVLLWVIFSSADRKNSYSAIPSDFSLYVRTDSVWDSVEPLLDLQAAEILLADPSLASARTMFLNFRSSDLRKNIFVKAALRKRVDLALYDNNSALAVVNLGGLSCVSRLFPIVYKSGKLSIPDFRSYIDENSQIFYLYDNSQIKLFAKPVKNLVLISTELSLLQKAYSLKCASSYSEKSLEVVKERLTEPFMISVDGKRVASQMRSNSKDGQMQNAFLDYIFNHLSSDDLSRINFGISDTDISLRADFNFDQDQDFYLHPMGKIIFDDSTIPSVLTKFSQNVQYYTLINASSLEDIKNAAFSALPEKVNIDSIWQAADGACKMLFGMGLDQVLFSWTGGQYALCGIEGKSEPVFIAEIKDEKQRQYIFENILSSAILKSNDSLLIDGFRLPRMEIPQSMQNLLKVFGLNLPNPYYLVKDGFVYFSQSPENLVTMNAVKKNSLKFINTENYKRISENQSSTSTLSLFYNLERSLPFFLKNNSTFANILKLYHIGRFDVSCKDGVLTFELDATALKTTDSKILSGFPLSLGKEKKSLIKKSDASGHIYFLEGNKINAFNTLSLEKTIIDVDDMQWIEVSDPAAKSKGELWAVSRSGNVYLYDMDLKLMPGFPLLAESAISAPVAYGSGIIYVSENENHLVCIDDKGSISEIEVNFENVVSSPAVDSKAIALYDKGFLGKLLYIKDRKQSGVTVFGIGFGSPVFGDFGKFKALSFISQSGQLFIAPISNEGISESSLKQLQLEGVFNQNVKIARKKTGANIVALSQDGKLYSIDIASETETSEPGENSAFAHVKIPYFTAESAFISIIDYDGDGEDEIFVCGDGNMIYGFRNNLNMLEGFPVSGYGNCVFMDVNGDNKKDCLTLSLDNKLYAYKIE
ncbi:MAG: hypothetical protein K5839_02380 [Treponemataceae bacterium]|nr:hypothetical protein [Treponemataceae bacterium]